jgi:signal transduction histidine kinase
VGAPATGDALEHLVREHAALRRVATLVAREPSPVDVFAAVTREAGVLLGAQTTTLLRVDGRDTAVVVAGWSDGAALVPVGSRGVLDGRGLVGRILRTRAPVRIEDFDEVGGAVAAQMRELGIRSAVAGPIVLGGRIWGALSAAWPEGVPMPAGAEDRIAAFAELVSYAIENAETREELAASRARIVEAADEQRRRIERDLHDGAQQQLVAAALALTLVEQRLERDVDGARTVLASAREQLDCGLGELRDLARGIHPAVLTDRGLDAALSAVAGKSAIPVTVEVELPQRLPEPIETTAYFVVAESLANIAKHSQASQARVIVRCEGGEGATLVIEVADDGIGGVDPAKGSGLTGLRDRLAALDGRLLISSPHGGPTWIRAELPCG